MPEDKPAAAELPQRANLEQQKKRARELLRAAEKSDAVALQRIHAHRRRGAPGESERRALALHDAQHTIACEYGFGNWAELKREIERRRLLRQTRMFVSDRSYYQDRVEGLVGAHSAGVPQALEQIREWHPDFATAADEDIAAARFDIDASRLVYAREHGFATWTELMLGVDAIATGARREPFKEAYDALQNRQWDRLLAVVRRHPDLVAARGTNGNTLLNLAVCLAGSSGEALPHQAGAILEAFLGAGANVNEANDRGWTPVHQAGYANLPDLARLLIAAGATLDGEAHGTGGTPLAVALFWGNREVADVLAEFAVLPRNLRIAAGLGRTDLIDACFGRGGGLTETARSGRGFYRPHSGFPIWHPTDERQEILDEALVWACKADRVDVLPGLLDRGAAIDADPYRGTPLIWAAAKNRLATARWLLEHGAAVDRCATFGGPSHGEDVTALHLAAQSNHAEMARLLLEFGGDPTIEDALYGSSALGWAKHFGSHAVELVLNAG